MARPAGVPNWRSLDFRRQMLQASEKERFDLIEATVKQAAGTDETILAGLEPNERAQVMEAARKRLQTHAYPALKAIEVQDTTPKRIIITDESKAAPAPAVDLDDPLLD